MSTSDAGDKVTLARRISQGAASLRATWASAKDLFAKHGPNRRGLIALAMALVATLGAVSAYRSSSDDLSASLCEHNLDELRVYLLAQLQVSVDRDVAYARLNEELNETSHGLAQPQRGGGELVQNAQVEAAIARQLAPVRNFFLPFPPDKAHNDARELALGACPQAAASALQLSSGKGGADEDPLLDHLQAQVDALHRQSAAAALAAAIFVIALVFLTFSDVFRGRVQPWMERCGLAACIVAVGIGLWADRWLWTVFLATALAFVAIGAAAWTVILRLRMAEPDEPDEPAELLEFSKESFPAKGVHLGPHRRANATIVILISMAALFSALSGYGYSVTLGRSASEAAVAARYQSEMLGSSARDQAGTYRLVEQALADKANEMRTKAAQDLAWRRSRSHGADTSSSASGSPREAQPFAQVGAPQGAPSGTGAVAQPMQDPLFPRLLFITNTVPDAARLFAYWDAHDDVSQVWQEKAGLYLSTLTIFAIALYLFGQALAMGTARPARVLAFFGVLLLTAGLGLGTWSLIKPVPSLDDPANEQCATDVSSGIAPSQTLRSSSKRAVPAQTPDTSAQARGEQAGETRVNAAAACYALGELQNAIAADTHDADAAKQASAAYDAAARLRPGFAFAQYRAAEALTRYETLDVGGFNPSAMTKTEFATMVNRKSDALARLFAARDLTPPAVVLSDYGFDEYLMAVAEPERESARVRLKQLDESIAMTRGALRQEIDEHGGFAALRSTDFNLGLELLAAGKPHDALVAYDEALRRAYQEAVQRGDFTQTPSDAAVSAASLELLQQRCSGLSGAGQDSARCKQLSQRATLQRGGLTENPAAATEAITNLEMLRRRCLDLPGAGGDAAYCERLQRKGGTIDSIERRLIQAAWPSPALGEPVGAFAAAALAAKAVPGGFGWRLKGPITGRRPENVLVVLAYEYNKAWDEWRVLSSFSHQVGSADMTREKDEYVSYRLDRAESNYRRCLDSPAKFRIGFYLNGVTIAAPAGASLSESTPFVGDAFWDVGVALCHPKGWRRETRNDGNPSGTYHSVDGASGVSVVSVFTGEQAPQDVSALVDERIEALLASLHEPALRSGSYRAIRMGSCNGFGDDWRSDRVVYVAPSLTVMAKAKVAPDGTVRMALVWRKGAPTTPAEDAVSCGVMTSLQFVR
jgi:hypothetical protein